MSRSTTNSNPSSGLEYQSGFGNHFATEAIPGVLPEGQNSPQQARYGLYAELLSGTAFTAARSENRRTWTYRIRPSAVHQPFSRIDNGLLRSAPFDEVAPTPTQLRWNPFEVSSAPVDFVESLMTLGGNGDTGSQSGIAVHVYVANRSMGSKVFTNVDGELLIVPQRGELRLVTELGILEVSPNEIALIPRGIRFRVELPTGEARGYICENYGPMLRLPELGPIGSNGLANPRDFRAPVAAFEDSVDPHQIVIKFAGNLWRAETDRSPLDVVAWHGNLAPWKYGLANFMAIGSISFDHPDPSIYTVLASASVDFVIFPPRWLVAEHTFRPPWYHRNVMSEFMGLIAGVYDAKAQGFLPGGASLHNSWSAHGPDAETYERASTTTLQPQKIEDSMAFMFESRMIIRPTTFAMEAKELQKDYFECWQGLRRHFRPPGER